MENNENSRLDIEKVEELARVKNEIVSEIGKVIVGQEEVIELLLAFRVWLKLY